MSSSFKVSIVWLISGTIGHVFALNFLSGAYVDGTYYPMGPDSFYHARRILAAIENGAAIMQFDPDMHIPEGSWVTWPWFYDQVLALVGAGYVSMGGADPMSVIVYVPAVWVFVNTGLVILVAGQLALPLWMRFLSGLIFATSPFTTTIHGVGVLDHHYMEQTLVLASVLAGLAWFRDLSAGRYAFIFGAVLGLAYGVHNSLFIIQLPFLVAAFILWVTGALPRDVKAGIFALGLVISALVMLVPSEPFRQGLFQFYTLSWFHLYVAACTSAVFVYMARYEFRYRHLVLLILFVAGLSLPLIIQVKQGLQFVQADMYLYEGITESVSVWGMFSHSLWPLSKITGYYSWLIWLVPIIIVGVIAALVRVRHIPLQLVYFYVFAVWGLGFMLFQYRFHYYGSFFVYLVILFFASRIEVSGVKRRLLPVVLSAVLLISYAPGISFSLNKRPLAWSTEHSMFLPLYRFLGEVCHETPGGVLAKTFDGHYITYYTECSVISNNFLISPQHFEKARRADYLLSLPLHRLAEEAVEVDYIFAKLYASDLLADGFENQEARAELLDARRDHFEGMTLLLESSEQILVGDKPVKVGRLFRLNDRS